MAFLSRSGPTAARPMVRQSAALVNQPEATLSGLRSLLRSRAREAAS